MFWKRLLGNKKVSRHHTEPSNAAANWPCSLNGEIVSLWHNPAGKNVDAALSGIAPSIRAATVARAMGQRDPMVEADTASLAAVDAGFGRRTIKVWSALEELSAGHLKHLMVQFADGGGDGLEAEQDIFKATLEIAMAVEPDTPGFYGISVADGRRMGHVFWPVDWNQADAVMPVGPGPYWVNPLRIDRKEDSFILHMHKEFNEVFERAAPDASRRIQRTVGFLLLALRLLDRQHNWDLLLLCQRELWPPSWSPPFQKILAAAANHRLWNCRACDVCHLPDIPLTPNLFETIVTRSRHGELSVPLTLTFTTSDACCWPVSENLLFCHIEYICATCGKTFNRKLFVETVGPDEDLPDLAATDTSLHRCPHLSLASQWTTTPSDQEELAANGDLNTFDVDGLLAALETGDQARKLTALEKLAWSLYGQESSRVREALVKALRDPDGFVAVRAARLFLAEGKPGYRELVAAAEADPTIEASIRQSFQVLILNDAKARGNQ